MFLNIKTTIGKEYRRKGTLPPPKIPSAYRVSDGGGEGGNGLLNGWLFHNGKI